MSLNMKMLAEKRIALTVRAFDFFLKHLKLEDKKSMMSAEIVAHNQLPPKTQGVCDAQHRIDNGKIQSLNIKIKDTSGEWAIVEILAHEMIHAKQIFDERLTFKVCRSKLLGFIPWKYVSHPIYEGIDQYGKQYIDQMHEIVAFSEQSHLTKLFFLEEVAREMRGEKDD